MWLAELAFDVATAHMGIETGITMLESQKLATTDYSLIRPKKLIICFSGTFFRK